MTDFVKNLLVNLEPSEELPKKVTAFELSRNDKFNIELTVFSHANDKPQPKNIPLGLVYTSNNHINLKGYIGSGNLHGIFNTNVNSTLSSHNPTTATKSKYNINRINYTISDSPINYTVDRIANLPSHYLWPSSLNDKVSGQHERNFAGAPPIKIDITLTSTQDSKRTCARFVFGEHIAIISTMESENIPRSKGPGYIYYSGNPDTETREKIRASLSYAFGLPLVYLGSCFYQETGGLVSFEAVSPSTIGGRAWEVISQPFSPITTDGSNWLDESLLQKTAQAFFDNYDSMELRNFLFRLWHAEVSPTHMKAAYYGAMIESIQNRETQKNNSGISRTIIEKPEYRKAIKILSRFLQKQAIPEESKELLLHKIQGGNQAPQRIIAERFYTKLGLTLGNLELSAWSKRNDAAHGNEQLPHTKIDNYRSTKLLRIILGRIVTKILGTSSQYIDYYTLYHPIRNLNEAIPQDSEE